MAPPGPDRQVNFSFPGEECSGTLQQVDRVQNQIAFKQVTGPLPGESAECPSESTLILNSDNNVHEWEAYQWLRPRPGNYALARVRRD